MVWLPGMELAKRMVMASTVTLVNLNMVLSQITLSGIAELSSHLFSSAFFLSLTASLPLSENNIRHHYLHLATMTIIFHHIFLWQQTECQRDVGQVSLNNIKHQTSAIAKRGIYLQTQAWSDSSGLSEVFGRTPF